MCPGFQDAITDYHTNCLSRYNDVKNSQAKRAAAIAKKMQAVEAIEYSRSQQVNKNLCCLCSCATSLDEWVIFAYVLLCHILR